MIHSLTNQFEWAWVGNHPRKLVAARFLCLCFVGEANITYKETGEVLITSGW